MKTPLPYLENALDSGHRLLGFLPPSYDEFMDSDLIQSAVCMRLHELGENLATIRRKFPEFYEMHHAPEWQYLIAMRHIISHGYRQLEWTSYGKLVPPDWQRSLRVSKRLVTP